MRIPRNFSRHFGTNLDRKFIIRKKNCKSWYVITFDYTDKVLIVLSATSGGVSIISFTSVVGIPVQIARLSFTLIFSLTIKNN